MWFDFRMIDFPRNSRMRMLTRFSVVIGVGIPLAAQCKVIGLGIHRPAEEGRRLQEAGGSSRKGSQFVKYDPHAINIGPKAVDETNTDTLTSIQAIYYVGPVEVGTQTFQVIYDTGSNLLWVPGSSCTQTCSTKQKFDGEFTDENSAFTLTYGSGTVKGDMITAPVSFAEANLTSFDLGLASEVNFPGYDSSAYDGLMGLAWPNLNQDTSIASLVPSLYEAGEISQNLFSIYLSADGTTGELSLGEIDPLRYTGDIIWMPLVLKQWWTVTYAGYDVNGGAVQSSTASIPAIIDSGTSLIVGPEAEVTAIMNTIVVDNPDLTVYYSSDNQLYAVDCSAVDSLPTVTMYLKGSDKQQYAFSLPGKSYVVPTLSSDSRYCPLAFQPSSSEMWILGDPFLRAFYTIYDYDNARVGMATTNPPAGTAVPYGGKAGGKVISTQWAMTLGAIFLVTMYY
jgi:hypothetical protein